MARMLTGTDQPSPASVARCPGCAAIRNVSAACSPRSSTVIRMFPTLLWRLSEGWPGLDLGRLPETLQIIGPPSRRRTATTHRTGGPWPGPSPARQARQRKKT